MSDGWISEPNYHDAPRAVVGEWSIVSHGSWSGVFSFGPDFVIVDGRPVAIPEGHAETCRTYWGSHGCHLPRGHKGEHLCECTVAEDGSLLPHGWSREAEGNEEAWGNVGRAPYYGRWRTVFFGEDAPLLHRLRGRWQRTRPSRFIGSVRHRRRVRKLKAQAGGGAQ